MTSSFGARRAENIGALFEKVIDRVVGVDAGEENLAVAHNYCMYHTRHHSSRTDPRDARDRLDALRQRLQPTRSWQARGAGDAPRPVERLEGDRGP